MCLAFGERGESQFAWKQTGMTLEKVKAGRKRRGGARSGDARRRDRVLRCRRLSAAPDRGAFERLVDIFREIQSELRADAFTGRSLQCRSSRQPRITRRRRASWRRRWATSRGAEYNYAAPPVFLFEPHQPEMCNFKPQVILNIDEVWDIKRKTFEILAAQKHLWAYYERVALQRGMQGGRNSGKAMTYGEAYQRLFPMAWRNWHEDGRCPQHQARRCRVVKRLGALGVVDRARGLWPLRADEALSPPGMGGRARPRAPR